VRKIRVATILPAFVFFAAALLFAEGPVAPEHEVESGKEVHQWIANEAHTYFTNRIEGADITAYLGTIDGSFDSGDNDLIEGTYAEDQNGRNPLNQSLPYVNHFCGGGENLRDGLNYFGSHDSALEQAENIWPHAVSAYPSNRAYAFYCLGHVVHLLEDSTVPAHVHNDDHLPWDSDSYETKIGENNRFKQWFFGSEKGHWEEELSVHSSLEDIFYRTVNYTEDYDSNDEDGDGPPYYNPSDYPDTDHVPGAVSRSGGISTEEVLLIGDDLMPFAIRRAADLFRLFYSVVDSSAPTVNLTYPVSGDPGNPDVLTSTNSFELTATAGDVVSGVLKQGYRFHYAYDIGGGWSGWSELAPLPTRSSLLFSPSNNTLYAFQVVAENAGGLLSTSSVKYLSVETGPADSDGDGLPDDWETQYYGGPTNANPDAVSSNGVNTVIEAYIAGLDPTDAGALFIITKHTHADMSVLWWSSVSGRVYNVYWTSNLLSGFQPLGSNISWSGNIFTDTVHSAEDRGWYQINVRMEE